jgi:DNA-binding response OmpR family regulator
VVTADATLRALLESGLAAQPLPAAIVTTDPARVAALRSAHPRAPIVVVGIARGQVARALDDGADGALAGPPRPEQLRAVLRAVARRREPALFVGSLELRPRSRIALLDGAALDLSAREFDLLSCLAAAAGAVLSKAELAQRCWGAGAPASGSRALERCLCRLRWRLGRDAPMLVTVWGVGYRLGEPH